MISWVLVFDGGRFDRSIRFDSRRDADVWSWGYRAGRQTDYECALVYPFEEHDNRAAQRLPAEAVQRAVALSLFNLD